jgi:hypothetical protein
MQVNIQELIGTPTSDYMMTNIFAVIAPGVRYNSGHTGGHGTHRSIV